LEEPLYTRRIAVQVSGVDVSTLKMWLFRNVLDVTRWDGTPLEKRKRREGGNNPRRLYSTLDLIKLSVMATLIRQGMGTEFAAQAPALIESILSGEDIEALERGEISRHPVAFVVEEDRLEVCWFRSKSMHPGFYDSPVEAIAAGNTGGGFLLDWTAVVMNVFDELEAIEKGGNRCQ